MINFRTSSLFHYTSFNFLKKIILEGIKPNYCKEDFSYGKNERIIGIPMISFCDIPLMRAHVFTNRYGNHAIGLSKDWAIRNRINPILYVSNDEILTSLNFLKSYEQHLKSQLDKIGSDGRTLPINPNDKNSVSHIVPFMNHIFSHNANVNLFGYVKKYTGVGKKNNNQCNYEENEWRYIIQDAPAHKWLWNKDEYNKWRGFGQSKPIPTEALEREKLTFGVSDITHIIVEFERQIPDIIRYIDKLVQIGGTDKQISDTERKILYSKIISMEKIKKDF